MEELSMNNSFYEGKEPIGKYVPIVDREFNVIAYEAVVQHVEPGTKQGDFDLSGFSANEFTSNFDYYYQEQALENFKGKVPLFLHADGEDPLPDAVLRSEDVKIVLMLDSTKGDNNKYWHRVEDLFQDSELSFTVQANVSEDEIPWPTVLFTHPGYIMLPFDVYKLLVSGDFLSKPQEVDCRFVVAGVESGEDFERVKSIADAFMGSWITEKVTVASK
jgi:hypothetical protein